MNEIICQYCKRDFTEYPEDTRTFRGKPACFPCTDNDDGGAGKAYFENQDSEALQHYYPNEDITEGGL